MTKGLPEVKLVKDVISGRMVQPPAWWHGEDEVEYEET